MSARAASQARQTPASTPQRISDGALQVGPAQQPPAQVSGLQPSQAPPSQRWPFAHAEHDEPLAPQARSLSPASQTSPLQQPAQAPAVQWQASFTHAVPVPQAAVQAPQAPATQVSRF